jgi:hypothetical protein
LAKSSIFDNPSFIIRLVNEGGGNSDVVVETKKAATVDDTFGQLFGNNWSK